VVVQPLSAGKTAKRTNLHDPLAQAPRQLNNLRAIVVASDGDWNDGREPVEAASALRLKDIPVFTVPVGDTSRLPDIELLSLDAPTFGIVDKSVRIPFTVESTLPREAVSTVVLKSSDGQEVAKDIRIAPMGRTSDWIIWKPKEL